MNIMQLQDVKTKEAYLSVTEELLKEFKLRYSSYDDSMLYVDALYLKVILGYTICTAWDTGINNDFIEASAVANDFFAPNNEYWKNRRYPDLKMLFINELDYEVFDLPTKKDAGEDKEYDLIVKEVSNNWDKLKNILCRITYSLAGNGVINYELMQNDFLIRFKTTIEQLKDLMEECQMAK
jgi:hypothetical protein